MYSFIKTLMQKLAWLFAGKRRRQDTQSSNSKFSNPKHNLDFKILEETPLQSIETVICETNTDHEVNDFYSLIGSLTDLCDELKTTAYQAANGPSAEQFRQLLIDKMELVDVLMINEPMWDILKQRAVKVALQDGSGIKVLSSARTGISYRKKIIRKEEVIISK